MTSPSPESSNIDHINLSSVESVVAYPFQENEFKGDEENRPDYILVVSKDIKKSKYFHYVERFLLGLQERGIDVDLAFGEIATNIFIKLKISQDAIEELANIYDVDIKNSGHYYISVSVIDLKITRTPVALNQDIFRRRGEVTSMERILILFLLLRDIRFGESRFDNNYGLEKLLRLGAIQQAYPLHDGDYHFDKNSDDTMNDRQILFKYWANFSMWYKQQPLNLMEKYYGTEVAFYFAWIGLYNSMLIPASIIGVIFFFLGAFQAYNRQNPRVSDTCNSKLNMCPPCLIGHTCISLPLESECYYTKLSILFDNYATFAFAVFMSFWATAFVKYWKRTEEILKIRWHVENREPSSHTRLVYIETTTHNKMSEITGKLEPYTPLRLRICYYFLTYGSLLLLISVVIFAVLGVILYRITMTALIRISGSQDLIDQSPLIQSVTSSILQVIFIKLYARLYGPMSIWLAKREHPRTQLEFDNSVIHKRYLLGFTNNYAGLFYASFIKGKFYSPRNQSILSFSSDRCYICGCLTGVCIQLFVIMLLKSLLGNILTLVVPMISKSLETHSRGDEVPQWEQEFLLFPAERYLLATNFMDMMIQYGFVTFFVGAFPLAPLCALINNCLQLRLNAYQLVTRYRRPNPRRYAGIGPWNNILERVTHFGVVTNAFVVAFTSDFVPREIYRYKHKTLSGYVQSTLSVFDMKDHINYTNTEMFQQLNNTVCYYRALRYPPNHPQKYQLTREFWFEMAMRLLCVVVFEHIVVFSKYIISLIIPDHSKKLKEGLYLEKARSCEKKLAAIHENIAKLRQNQGKVKVTLPRKKNL